MILSKCAAEKYAQRQTTPAACRAESATVKTFISAWDSNRQRRSRFSRKPSPNQSNKASSRRADAMIREFFLEQCQVWKRGPRLSFAITQCGSRPVVIDRSDVGTAAARRIG